MRSFIKYIISHVNPDIKRSRQIILLLGIVVYFIVFYFVQNFQNLALLWGDEWEYQAMAVNFAKGYGLQIHGGLANFEDYKFLYGSNDYVEMFTKQNQYDFYRPPLYPLFVGVIYKIFGISPYIAKIIQLLLIVFVGACLPLLAYDFWGKKGFYSGLIASPVFISLNYQFAGSILTEPLVIFIIFIVIVVFQFHQHRNSIKSGILLGFVLALSWLTKGILMPLSLFLFGYYFWEFIKTKNRKILINTAVMGGMFILTILPYSLYVNTHSKEFIMISSQGKIILLESHNEFIKYGFWGPQGRADPKSFYNNDHMQNASQIKRVANFYIHYPEMIYKLFNEKIVTGFTVLSFVWLLIFCIIADNIRLLIIKYSKSTILQKIYGLLSILMIVAGYVLIAIRLKGQLYFLDYRIYKWLDLMGVVFIPFLVFVAVLAVWNYKKEKTIQFPLILKAVILNFVFMVVATCLPMQDNRYIKVIDFVFILLAVHYLLSYIRNVTATFRNGLAGN